MGSSGPWECGGLTGGCACRCHKLSAGRRASTQAAPRLWTPSMDAKLVQGIREGVPIKLLAQKLRVSLRQATDRLDEIGESTRTGWRTRHEAGLALGVSWRATARWQADGLLAVERYGRGRWWRIKDADLAAFVRQHAGVLFDAAKVRDPALKRVAEVAALANRRQAAS